jgi:hypothetical protein
MASFKIINKLKCEIQGRFKAKALLYGSDGGVKISELVVVLDFFCHMY